MLISTEKLSVKHNWINEYLYLEKYPSEIILHDGFFSIIFLELSLKTTKKVTYRIPNNFNVA